LNELNLITAPIRRELTGFKNRLNRSVNGLSGSFTGPIRAVRYFFGNPGKFLRPILVLLSAGAVRGRNRGAGQKKKILVLASAVEFIHAASLLHDDILDGSLLRRGRPAVNRKFGTMAAVLAGDLLYINALKECTRLLPQEVVDTLLACVEGMCGAEVDRISRRGLKYFDLVRSKTARLMSACCGCAAIVAAAGPPVVRGFFRFGLDFGMAYQFMDDSIDGDGPLSPGMLRIEAEKSMKNAFRALSGVPESPCKRALKDFGKFILALRAN